MAEFYVNGDKCKSFEIAVKRIVPHLKAGNSIFYLDFRFRNGETHVLVARNVGNRIECCYPESAARIFDELLTEAFLQSKKE